MRKSESNDSCNGGVASLARRDCLIRWAKRLACLTLAAAFAFAAFNIYGAWRKRHLAAQLQQFVQRTEFESAVLVARRLLALDPDDLAACTAMAQIAENAGRAEAVIWRKKIAHLQTGDVPSQIALAGSALRFGQHDLARRVLESVVEAARGTVQYHEVAGAQALATQQFTVAESHFAAAVKLDPTNPQLAMNVALVRLASGDSTAAAEARARLAALAEQPGVRVDALRALASDALAHKDSAAAIAWARKLRGEKEASFSDALLCYHAFEGTDAAAAVLAELKTKAASKPVAAAELITWMNRNGMAADAIEWSSILAGDVQLQQPVPLAIAESYSFRQDWPAMLAFVEGKNWAEFEALRLGVESHALHRLGPTDRSSMQTQTTWRSALDATKTHPDQLIALAHLAEGWGYINDAEQAWWMIASGKENPQAGLFALQRLYKAKRDTRGLLRVAARALELNPGDLVAANNCASLGLLLNGDSSARRRAAKLYGQDPTNHAFTATYAFALHIDGKIPEALKLMETLSEEELRLPAIAAYYFMMLVDSGNFDRARPYLLFAERATLLPEEKQLVTAATRKLLANAGEPSAPHLAKSLAREPLGR